VHRQEGRTVAAQVVHQKIGSIRTVDASGFDRHYHRNLAIPLDRVKAITVPLENELDNEEIKRRDLADGVLRNHRIW
jgi:hypothetical protein